MNAKPDPDLKTDTPQDLPEAVYFDAAQQRLFGWYHRSEAGSAAKTGVVVCKPFGYEAICAHRSMRSFAQAAAALGFPVLRFDYAGTGDSSDIDPESDQIPIWTDSVIAAVGELKRLSGVDKVCLLGFRLGALLACLAATRCDAIDGLILVAPIVKGRRYVRELRTMRLAASMGSESPIGPEKSATGDNQGSMEVSGFLYSAATMSALSHVELQEEAVSNSIRVLVLDGAAMPVNRQWAEQLSRAGVDATYMALPGMVEMLMTAPHFAAIPQEMIAAFRDWLTKAAGTSTAACNDAAAREARPVVRAPRTLQLDGPAQGQPITERPLFLTSHVLLFGIVTEPAEGTARRGVVIMVNAGADYHIGASGMYVGFARRWARIGYVVLRIDLAGIGDSGTRPGRPDDEVFPPAALDDIGAALEWVRSRYGDDDVTLCGLCSGAYHVLRAAIARMPVKRILMINPETFFWSEGMSIYDRQTAELVRQQGEYRGKIFSAASWKRLLNGQIDLRYVIGTYSGRLSLALESGLHTMARRLRIRLSNDLGSQLSEVASRGVRLVFIFSRGEPGLELLRLQGGASPALLGDQCKIHVIDDADHVFSKIDSRTALDRILSEELSTSHPVS